MSDVSADITLGVISVPDGTANVLLIAVNPISIVATHQVTYGS